MDILVYVIVPLHEAISSDILKSGTAGPKDVFPKCWEVPPCVQAGPTFCLELCGEVPTCPIL